MPTNIAITGDIYGQTNAGKVVESGTIIASNPAGSGKVLRVGNLLVSNTTGSANADLNAVLRRGGTVGASSIYFDGASYLTLSTSAGLSFSGDFTIEAFIYLLSNANYGGILDCRTSSGSSNYFFGVRNNSYQRLVWGTSTISSFESGTPIYFGRWTHVAIVRSGSTLYFYIDGVRDANTATLSGSLSPSSSTPRIGSLVEPHYFNGYMEEIRVSNIARYSGTSFAVPTSPFADNHANSMLLLHGDGENNSDTFTNSVLSPQVVSRFGSARIVTSNSVFIGEDTRLAQKISVPASSSLLLSDKPIYLEEGDRLVCYASTNERLEYICSYEEIG